MRQLLRVGLAAVAALTLGTAGGGSRAFADLTLDVHESGGPEIVINSTTGSYTFTGGAILTSYTFQVNGSALTFTTDGSGNKSGGAGTVSTNNTTVSFKADGTDGTAASFGDYVIHSVTATQHTNGSGSKSSINDITTDVGGTNSSTKDLNIGATYGFTQPSSTHVLLESVLSPSNIDSGAVTFTSSLNGTTTTPLTATAPSTQITSTPATPASNPYDVSNLIVIHQLATGDTDNISATTNVYATPEPATFAMALSALPLVALALRRRGAKA